MRQGQPTVIRASLRDISQRGVLDNSTGAFYYDTLEVSVVYFRAGYTPDDYPTEVEWDARKQIGME